MNSHELLKQRYDTLEALKKLRENVDPASGITVCVQRGPVGGDVFEEATYPWVTMEIGERASEVIDLLIKNQTESVDILMRLTEKSITEAQITIAKIKTKQNHDRAQGK